MTPSGAGTEGRRPRRASPLSALAALLLGLVAALVLGEGLVRLAARWSPAVRYLSVLHTTRPLVFGSLAEYLASMPTQVVPHRNWFNYWNNALGFNDEEFVVPKPAGRFRIMALGDSFTYGLVPYPDSVMTVLERRLRSACPGKDLDVLNFGIGGIGVEDYRAIVTLGFTDYTPDLVVIHFYAGNDGPDTYRVDRGRERRRWQDLTRYSRLWTLTQNVVLVRKSLEATVGVVTDRPSGRAPDGTAARGGAVVDPGYALPADDRALMGPTFNPETFDRIMGDELRRLYTAADPVGLDRAWQPTFDNLETIRERVTVGGGRLALVVFPSVLQVDGELREQVLARLHARGRYRRMSRETIDPELPQKRLAAYCRRAGVPCVDVTPALIRALQAEPSARLYKLQETHWTVRGNRVAAEAEAEQLLGLVCPRPAT